MNLLELNKKAKEFITKEKNIKEEKQNYEEIQELIYEISIGKIFHSTNNKKMFDEIGIKLKQRQTDYQSFWFRENQKYGFELDKTNISKIQKYIDKEKENESNNINRKID